MQFRLHAYGTKDRPLIVDLEINRENGFWALEIEGTFLFFLLGRHLGNPIKRQETELQRDKCPAVPVQNIFKKVKKNLVTSENLH